MLQCPSGYWPVLLGAEWLLIYWLTQAVGLTHLSLLMIGSLMTLLPVALISRYRHKRDWRTLLLQGAALTAAALLQSLPWLWHGKESWNALLLTLTGGLTLAPICLVFWHYLANKLAHLAVTGCGVNGGGVVAVVALALARQRVVECAAADFNWRPDAGPDMSGVLALSRQ